MACTNKESDTSMRQRKNEHSKDQDYTEQNAGGISDHISDLAEWKRQLEGLKAQVVDDLSRHLRALLDKAVTEAVQSYRHRDNNADSVVTKRSQGPISERRKIFQNRTSLLDDLMEVEHLRTIYHMFAAVFCVFIISTVAVDIIDQGRISLELELVVYTFGKPGIVVLSWACFFIYTLTVPYKALQIWGSSFLKTKRKILLSVTVGTLLLLSKICVLGVFPIYVVIHYELPPCSSFIVLLEQVRFAMKSYAFLREGVSAVLLQKEKKEVQLPQFSSYLYFLFCPTLIYRDSYPRTPYIRWRYVIKYFAEFLGCLCFANLIVVTLCTPVFNNLSKQPLSAKTLVVSIFQATLPGSLMLVVSFYALLHCWMNAFAEMLRFADRMFYKDWWNSTSFSNYYRTWNVVVHDWLFYYVYQDLLWLMNQRCRAGVTLFVFLLSASVHEYVLTLSFGSFYPVLFCLFAIFGVLFNFIINDKKTSPVYNVLVWTFLFIGQGIQFCLYFLEWYTRKHCPQTEKTFWGLVIPRTWSCHFDFLTTDTSQDF